MDKEKSRALQRLVDKHHDLEENLQHRRTLLREYDRRLHPLEQQQAQMGLDTRPQIVNEIADIRMKIAQIRQEVTDIEKEITNTQQEINNIRKELDALSATDVSNPPLLSSISASNMRRFWPIISLLLLILLLLSFFLPRQSSSISNTPTLQSPNPTISDIPTHLRPNPTALNNPTPQNPNPATTLLAATSRPTLQPDANQPNITITFALENFSGYYPGILIETENLLKQRGYGLKLVRIGPNGDLDIPEKERYQMLKRLYK